MLYRLLHRTIKRLPVYPGHALILIHDNSATSDTCELLTKECEGHSLVGGLAWVDLDLGDFH